MIDTENVTCDTCTAPSEFVLEQTEALFLSAKLEDAALQAPNDAVRATVVRLGNQINPHVEEEIA